MNYNEIDSNVCRNLRLPLALMVVFIHSFIQPEGYTFQHLSSGVQFVDIYNFVRIFISCVFSQIAVPVFYIISGYYFFFGCRRLTCSEYYEKLKKRWKSLAVPYITWNTLAIVLSIAGLVSAAILGSSTWEQIFEWFSEKKGITGLYWNCNEWYENYINLFGEADKYSSPFLVPMWFIRDLIVVVLLSPIIYCFNKKAGKLFMGIISILILTGISSRIPEVSLDAFAYFSIGSFFSINNISISEKTDNRVVWLSSTIIALITSIIVTFGYNVTNIYISSCFRLFILSGSISLLSSAFKLYRRYGNNKFAELLKYGSKYTFFVFAAHTILGLRFINPIIYRFLNFSSCESALQTIAAIGVYLFTPMVVILLCVCIYQIFSRLLPPPHIPFVYRWQVK